MTEPRVTAWSLSCSYGSKKAPSASGGGLFTRNSVVSPTLSVRRSRPTREERSAATGEEFLDKLIPKAAGGCHGCVCFIRPGVRIADCCSIVGLVGDLSRGGRPV